MYVKNDSTQSEPQTSVWVSDSPLAPGTPPLDAGRLPFPASPSPSPRAGAGRGREAAALDTPANIATPPQTVDPETGEIVPVWDPTTKWQLQAVARAALGQDHRINHCHRHLQGHQHEVEIRERINGGTRFLGNLQTCGSVWVCPVCAAKIQAVRATETRQMIDTWTEQGGGVLLMTQTVRHSRADVLGDILDALKAGIRDMANGSPYRRARERLGLAGKGTGYEVTFGEVNGWHPHAHTLLFVGGDVGPDAARKNLWPLWERAAHRVGLDVEPSGFDVRDGSAVRSYVTKMGTEYLWNAEHEVVKSHTKRGRAGMTPFDMLRQHLEDPGDGRWLARFAEFGFTFHGRRQLSWSRGFKQQLLGQVERSDETIAASIGEAYHVLARITAQEWIALRKAGHHGGTVLQVYDLHGWDGLQHLINDARGKA